nr:hypothetical protein [uncultured Flavobacterium sp.]
MNKETNKITEIEVELWKKFEKNTKNIKSIRSRVKEIASIIENGKSGEQYFSELLNLNICLDQALTVKSMIFSRLIRLNPNFQYN